MNKKIKSISEILLFPFIFSMFNPAYSLAMSGKEVFDSIQSNNGIKKEDINNQFFDKLVDSCIKDYFEKKNEYISKLFPYQRNYVNAIIKCSDKFKENIVEISKNIYNILLLYPFDSHDFELCYKNTTSSSIINLVDMYAHFIEIYSKLALKKYLYDSRDPIEFEYNFPKKSFLKDLVKCLCNCNQKGNFEGLELLKNFEENFEKFSGYCKQINKSMFEITSIINDECVPEQVSSSQIFYCTEMFFQRLGKLIMPDIAIISTFN